MVPEDFLRAWVALSGELIVEYWAFSKRSFKRIAWVKVHMTTCQIRANGYGTAVARLIEESDMLYQEAS